MEDVLNRLIQVIQKETEIIRALIDCGKLKQEYIIGDNIKELDKLLPKENLLLTNLNRWEEERISLQEKLAAYLGIEGEELKAQRLLEEVKASFPFFYPSLVEAVEELASGVSFLQYLNQHNNELIEQALQYIETVQALLEGDRPGIYAKDDKKAETAFKRINLIDKRV
ncbi:FlgN protein [Thermosyntropha lipolytica DSM 11003]|uniref:FlgN protein n=1 Tax=Thermosyntropha lipolytica DSM 11003 TaxID=1123382 RepID=A0A1M5Q8D8_9FIRM|nr:flagellar protein FlgN [Thermosyntropha lipolytica]SHH09733.1 FlgN protein [Thermosyntropha lipolytica DSM 11003]